MKRNMDLCRRILLDVEASPEATGLGYIQLNIEGHDATEVSYHVQLLSDAGLLEAVNQSYTGPSGFVVNPKRLTYAGHEFIEASRNDSFWQKAKTTVLEKTGGLSGASHNACRNSSPNFCGYPCA
jgi:hypothetical protein